MQTTKRFDLNWLAYPAKHFSFAKKVSGDFSLIFIGESLVEDAALMAAFKTFEKDWNQAILKKILKEKGLLSIGLIETENLQHLKKSLSIISQKIDPKRPHFVILPTYEEPKENAKKTQITAIESFLTSSDYFIDQLEPKVQTGLCYHFSIKAISKESQIDQILVNQIGHPNPYQPDFKQKSGSIEMVIPHKGNLDDLSAALWSIEKQTKPVDQITVCFDEAIRDEHYQVTETNSTTRFFVNHPTGVGPYPPRDLIARTTNQEMIVFQDSDDISTSDRILTLTNFLQKNNLDAVGSHELRINKIRKIVEAIRFPLHVNEAINQKAKHSIMFPTTAIKKETYLKVGGLSTIRKHSSDAQFYLRAHFFAQLKNVDEFLYLRVKRSGSLTTDSPTALGSPVRERLGTRWRTDFMNVRYRNIRLVQSALIDEYRDDDFNLIPLLDENRELIDQWQKLSSTLEDKTAFKNKATPAFPSEKDILEDRILESKNTGVFKTDLNPNIIELRESMSWRIGWRITRIIIFCFGWIPFIKKRL